MRVLRWLVVVVLVLGGVFAVAVAAAGGAAPQTVYVSSFGSNVVTPIDVATNTTGSAISVGAGPYGSAVSPDGSTLYVANSNDNTVSVINTATDAVATTITGVCSSGESSTDVAITPNGQTAYATCFSAGNVAVIDLATDTVTSHITVGSSPVAVAITPDGSTVYVANPGSNSVSVISTASNTVTGTITGTGLSSPQEVAVTPDGKTAYISWSGSGEVTPVAVGSTTLGTAITVGSSPIGEAITPDGTTVYVTNFNSQSVSVISTATNTVTATIPTGSGTIPYVVAITTDGKTAYVGQYYLGTNTVIPITVATNTAGTPLSGFNRPEGLSILGPLEIGNPPVMAQAAVGASYSQQLWSVAGTSPFTYEVTGGSLPAGLTLSSSGLISGTPTHAVNASFTVSVTDSSSAQRVAANAFTLNVTDTLPAPTVASVSPASADQGASDLDVKIDGTGFESFGAGAANNPVASFSGSGITVNSTSYVSATEVTANISISPGASLGADDVTVTNPDGGSATDAKAFTVDAAPAGSTSYVLKWATPGSIVFGMRLSSRELRATASVPGTFVYTPAAGSLLSAGTHTLSALFTPTDSVSYRAATVTTSLVVRRAIPTVAWATPAPMLAGATLSSAQLNATASVAGTFVYAPAAGTVVSVGVLQLSVTFTAADASEYASASTHVSVLVNGPAPSTAAPAPSASATSPAPPATSPAPPAASPTSRATPARAPAGKLLAIAIVGQPGIKISSGDVTVKGDGLKPGSTATIFVHSSPQLLASTRANTRGSVSFTVHLPAALPPGGHHIEVEGTSGAGVPIVKLEAFTVAPGNRLGSIGTIPTGPFATLVPFRPAAHVKVVLGVTVAGVAAIGGLAAALGAGAAGGGGGDGGGSGGNSGGGYLLDVELEREAMAKRGRGKGDRSKTWWWPFTRHVDRFSVEYPSRLAAISPVVGRVAVDGDYLRAMFGGMSLLLYPLAVALGIVAAASTGGAALPPALGYFLAILGLSIFDSMAGYAAGLAFAAVVVLSGGITGAGSVRELCGIVLVWFAVPLAAGAVRPLRRNMRLTLPGLWDRSADFVLAGLFGAWLAANMTEALAPLGGFELPLENARGTIALAVIGFVAIRIVSETIAAHHYPDRLVAVKHRGDLESGNLQVALSLVIQVALFIFIARAFMKWDWPLFAGAALFFSPLAAWLIVDRLPKSASVAKWMPLGLAKWSFVIIAGVLLSLLLEHVVSDPAQAEAYGFIFLPLPILVCWGLEVFAVEDEEEEEGEEEEGEEEGEAAATATPHHESHVSHQAPAGSHLTASTEHPEEEEGRFRMTWPLRIIGVPVLIACVYLVLSGIAGS